MTLTFDLLTTKQQSRLPCCPRTIAYQLNSTRRLPVLRPRKVWRRQIHRPMKLRFAT